MFPLEFSKRVSVNPHLAVVHGEAYYIAKFEEATAGPAPWAVEAAESESDAAQESVAAGEVPDESRD